jgi:hypothetical protein
MSVREILRRSREVSDFSNVLVDGVKRNLRSPYGEKTRLVRIPESLVLTLEAFLALYAESSIKRRFRLKSYLSGASYSLFVREEYEESEELIEESKKNLKI